MCAAYRVGVIGLGRMGSTIDDEGHTELPYSVAAATAASTQLELACGCDLLPERREAFSHRWGVEAVYEDVGHMVEQERPDIVAICTTATGLAKPGNRSPTDDFRGDSHAELTIMLAQMGVPMLYVEKAVACSMARADELRDAVRANNTLFNSGVLRRFDNRYDVVRDAVLAGRIGEPKVVIHYAASSLLHGHIHSLDTVSWLVGDPTIERVRGELIPRDLVVQGGHIPFDPPATWEIEMAGGIRAWSVPAGYWEFEVLGSEGAIRSMGNGTGASLRVAADGRGWEEAPLPAVEPASTTQFCLEDLVAAHEAGRPTRGHVDVTHHITEACLGVAQSHQQGGGWVELPGVDRQLYVFHV